MTDDKEENNDKLKYFVLRDIHYNQSTGFQNQKRTYEAAKSVYPTSHQDTSVNGSRNKRGSSLSHIGASIRTLLIGHSRKLLLIWLISAVTLMWVRFQSALMQSL